MSTLLSAALEYAARRLPIFPCVPNGKLPAVARGFYAATTNPETIKRHWRVCDRNIGIPTGSVSGFWVLDIDGDEGESSIRALEAEHGALPPTREVLTGGGGRHLWFKYTGPIQSTTGRIAPGIDTRGDGGYVIVPPSIHENGRIYTWSVDSYDQLAIGPDWLIQLARTKPQSISERALGTIRPPNGQPNAYGFAALDREIEALAGTPAGARNHALNRCSFRLFQLVAGG
jgi:putative DNA primase/helicase